MQLSYIVQNTVDNFINKVILEKDLSYSFPVYPWETLHRKELSTALTLSKLTGTSVALHMDFTREKQEILLRGAIEGNKKDVCAKLAKVHPAVMDKWLKFGEKGISPYKEFYLEYNLAEGLAQARDVRTLREGGWHGALESLKMRWGWAEADNNSGKNNTNITLNTETNITLKPLSEMKPEEKRSAIWELLDEANKNGKIVDME